MSNTTNKRTTVEELFEVERKLRVSASEYSTTQDAANRMRLRQAALAYADVANAINDDCEITA